MGQGFYFSSDNSKPFAGITRPCSFNGGIQGQQVGLIGNIIDGFRNFIDIFYDIFKENHFI